MYQTIHDIVGLRQERRVRTLASPCDGVLTQHGGELLLDGEHEGLVIFAVHVHALHILPGLVGDLIPEDGGGLVLQLSDGSLLQVSRDIMVEDLLGGPGINSLALEIE